MELRAGQRVAQYVLSRPLGAGGTAEVWEARHEVLQVRVALKVLSRNAPELQSRLLREARAQAAMRHPHIVAVRDVVDVAGTPGLVLALVEGPSLRELLDAYRPTEAESAALVRGIAAGLAHAHSHGFVHRDLKPANVLLHADGRGRVPRIADFGITTHADDPPGPRGQFLGTLRHAAPEQLHANTVVDHRADLFALGTILYQLLTGRPPFDACTIDTMRRAHRRGPELSLLPGGWRELCSDLLTWEAERRISDCAELERRLEELCSHRTVLRRLDGGLAEAATQLWETGRLGPDPVDPTVDAPMPVMLPEVDLHVPPTPPHNLGDEQDDFVGRAEELRALEALLEGGARLVTLLGTAGAGKTRLARQLARRQLPGLTRGVWFCDLSEVRSLEGACSAVATAVDLSLGRHPVGEVGAAIAGRGRCLLILDNFEQVAEHAASAVDAWREAAPDARLVVTSRVPLGLADEAIVPVGPLEPTSAELLFLRRARLRQPDLEVAPTLLSELTAQLDRLPLAIELAAAQVASMSPPEILAQLTAGVPRHATVQAAIDRSWDLLTPWQRSALAQLGVFEGGFTLDAAEAVVDLSEWPDAPWVVEVVRDLVERSLVVRLGTDPLGEPRFGMLISIHAYARAKLEEPPDGSASAVRRHASYFARFDDRGADRQLGRPEEVLRMRALVGELQNLVCAARRSPAESREATTRAAVQVLRQKGPYATGIALIEEAIAVLSDAGDEFAVYGLTVASSELYRISGRPTDALLCAQRALDGYRAAGDLAGEAGASNNLGNVYGDLARSSEAAAAYERSIELRRQLGDPFFEAVTRANFAGELLRQGRVQDAERHYLYALTVFEAHGARRRMGHVLGNLATVDETRGRVAEALERYTEAIALTHETGASLHEANYHGAIANLLMNLGELDAAREHFSAALALQRRLGARNREGATLGNLGVLYQRLGRLDEARAHYRLAVDIARAVEDRRSAFFTLVNLSSLCLDAQDLPAARAHLDEAERIRGPGSFLEAIELFFRGRVERARGDHDEGRALFARSEELLRACDAQELLGMNLGERALLECRSGDPDAARRCLAEAEQIAEALGMGPGTQLDAILREVRTALPSATRH